MANVYINAGAAWGRIDGTRVERGALFEPTPEERRTKRYKIRRATDAEISGGGNVLAATTEEALTRDTRPREEVSDDDVAPYHTGGGWYTLPGGARVQGKAKALAHLRGD